MRLWQGFMRRRSVWLAAVSTVLVSSSLGIACTISLLYRAAFDQQMSLLVDVVDVQASLLGAVAEFDRKESSDVAGGAAAATLEQFQEAQRSLSGLGHTGEFTLGIREDEHIRLLAGRWDAVEGLTIPWDSAEGEAMRRALAGAAGTDVLRDYESDWVLAAYRPIPGTPWGLVAKQDLAEVRGPFVRAATAATGVTAIVALLAVLLFHTITRPIFDEAARIEGELRAARQQLQRQLASSEEKLGILAETGGDLIASITADGYYGDVNRAALRVLGVAPAELLGRHILEFVSPEQQDEVRQALADVAADSADPEGSVVYRGFDASGQERWYESRFSRADIADAGGTNPLFIVTRDVTYRRALDERLRLLDLAVQFSREGIVITDHLAGDEPIVFASEGFYRLTGYTLSETLGRNARFLQGPQTDTLAREQLTQAIRSGASLSVDILNYRKSGEKFWNHLSISPVTNEIGEVTHYLGLLSDVTASHLLLEQHQQSQRMESLGKLAGGVAHDFNNLLTVIGGYGELLLEAEVDESKRHDLQQIIEATNHSSDLTHQLLAFSRKQTVRFEAIDTRSTVDGVADMLRRTLGEDIDLRVSHANQLPRVRGNASQLAQVLMNLAVNARHAMPHGGVLSIETSLVHLDQQYVRLHPKATEGPHVMLAVSDTGQGMDEETRRHAFDPFYTTKPEGKGTGLGLATVHGIISQHQGRVDLYSEPGIGTTLKIYLPAMADADIGQPLCAKPAKHVSAGGKVLVLDDDAGVRDIVTRLLRRAGFDAVELASAQAAVELPAEELAGFEVLVTDVVMPEMTGKQVYDALVCKAPGLRAVYMSGYTENVISTRGILHPGTAFVGKPIDPADLVRVVREAMREEPVGQQG